MARNYSDLSPYDFEVLVRDLLQAEFGVRMETFPQGRDGGVDIRLHRNGKESIIVQCKHSPNRTYAQIKAQLEREAEKVSGKFSCRYILATSASLTRSNKDEIVRIFDGVDLDQSDIFAVDDLENLLRRHPRVELDNFKLWITSAAVLEHLVKSDLYARNSSIVDSIVRRRKIYVHSEAFGRAREILNSCHVCIISGSPGIGKTTLAETLLLRLSGEGWEINLASEDVSDVDRAWKPERKQVFLYDDFLGQNTLSGSLNKNEDSRLSMIIERIRQDATKRLIMTTREYILAQARLVHEPLQRVSAFKHGKIILDLAKYTRHQKAQILYNHLHFSNLPANATASIITHRGYRRIIDHANFNPRLIELICSNFGASEAPEQELYECFMVALENPRDLWEQIFDHQLSRLERDALLILSTFRDEIELGDFVDSLQAYEASTYGGAKTDTRQLRISLKRLEGTFVEISRSSGPSIQEGGPALNHQLVMVRFANPSFVDYVTSYLVAHPEELAQVIRGCAFFEQAANIYHWSHGFATGTARKALLPGLGPNVRRNIVESMERLVEAPSSVWEQDGSGHRRKPSDSLKRYEFTLRAAAQSGKYITRPIFIKSACQNIALLAKEDLADSEMDCGLFVSLLRLLANYASAWPAVTVARNSFAVKVLSCAQSPEDYCDALELLTEIDLPEVRDSAIVEAKIRQSFATFAAGWDRAEAARINNLEECVEVASNLEYAIAVFGHPPGLAVEFLAERILLLRGDMEPDDYSQEGEGWESLDWPGRGSVSALREDHFARLDPIDDLFATLSNEKGN
ncbi:restriction endonuclease [Kitasatospora sp. NPDC059811]|uniref:restriction endonuclease n=1 Tax=Streptomycetaceae TaxID=2062 RepID=UPI0009A03B60|nr:restriction endonuclease [Streptomyces sp. MJM8645]